MAGRRALLLTLCSLAACLAATSAKIAVMFTELDFAVEEGISEVRVGVQKIGSNVGDITYTLTPLSLQQASSRYSYEVEGDSAEPDQDFNSQPIVFTVRPGTQLSREDEFAIPLLDDEAFEAEEVFVIRLDVNTSDPTDQASLSVRHWTKVFIRPGSDTSTLEVEVLRTSVSESDGFVEDIIRIVKRGISEIPIRFHISFRAMTASEGTDFSLATGQFSLQPADTTYNLSLTVLEDLIPEDTETIELLIDQKPFSVTIFDDDNMTVGFINGSEVTVAEGQSLRLCVGIMSPEMVERDVSLVMIPVPGTAKDGVDYVKPTSSRASRVYPNPVDCLDIQTIDDDIPESEETFQYSLSLDNGMGSSGLTMVEPATITIRVTDSDIPQLKADITIANTSDLSVKVGEENKRFEDFIRIFTTDPHPVSTVVIVTVNSSTAQSDQDFMLSTGSFIFHPDNSSLNVSLTLFDDKFVEFDEVFTITLTQQNTTYPPIVFTVTITDNDLVTVGFANDTVLTVSEGDVVRVCGKVVDVAPSLIQRELVLEGRTIPRTAQAGSDFKSVSWTYTFTASSPFECVDIPTEQDDTHEMMEVFLVSLTPLGPAPLVTVDPNSLEVEIVDDDVTKLEVEVVGGTTPQTATVGEGDGQINNLVRVFTKGIHPLNLIYDISVAPSGGNDFLLKEGRFSFSPSDTEQFLSLTILDDQVAEGNETFTITLFQKGYSHQIVTITIQDNDVVRVGFVNGSRVEVEEGHVARLCARILSPGLTGLSIMLQARTFQSTATAGLDFEATDDGWTVTSSDDIVCIKIETIENRRAELPRELQVKLDVAESQVRVKLETDIVVIVVTDNDGTPLAPEVMNLDLKEGPEGSFNLTFGWSSEPKELRPITFFTGTVTPKNPIKREEEEGKGEGGGKGRALREENLSVATSLDVQLYPFKVDNQTTYYKVVGIQLAEQYSVEVCAHNTRGFNCSRPAKISSGHMQGGLKKDEEDEVSVSLVVGIAVLALLLLCCCCFVWCICCCLLCGRRDNEKAYSPEEREKQNEKEFAKYREAEEEGESDFDSELEEV